MCIRDSFVTSTALQNLTVGILAAVAVAGAAAMLIQKTAYSLSLIHIYEKGALLITKSGTRICKFLGISKFTLYNYLDELRLSLIHI